jgi:hypothetical protein
MSRVNGHGPQRAPQPAPPAEIVQQQFEAVRGSNQERLGKLGQLGAEMDPFSFVHARIDSLIDSISRFAGSNGPAWAATARLEFEQHISRELDAIEKQATQAQLAQGALWTPAMIAELARATGMFRRS